MARKKRNKGSIAKAIIVLVSITLLNIYGISYAYWNNNLQIATSISTGNMDVQFNNADSVCDFETIQGEGALKARIGADEIIVEGEVSSDYKGVLDYSVINTGSIPAKYIGNSNGNICDSMEFLLDQNKVLIIENVFCGSNNFQLNVRVEDSGSEENKNEAHESQDANYTYDFEMNLPFGQSNH